MFNFFRNTKVEVKSSSFDEAAVLLGGGVDTMAGVAVGEESALRCAPAFACIRIIAETIQQTPVHLYRRLPDGGREKAADHPSARVLRQPNPWTSPAELKLLLGVHLATFGNAYCWLSRDDLDRPLELIPLDPRVVSVKADPATLVPAYAVTQADGTQRVFGREDILHVRGPGLDAYAGVSPVRLAREAIGLSLVLEKHCAALFGRGAKPSGMLKVTGRKNPDTLKRIRELFSQFYSGVYGAKTMLLEDDMSFEQVQLSSVDSQTLEMRRFQIAEIARVWRIPLSLLGELSDVKYATAESMGQQFLSFCMLPIFRNISDALALTLLSPDEREEYYFEFLVDDIVRADLAARMSAYATAISHGVLSPNDVRAKENAGPYVGGEVYTRPVNVAPVRMGSAANV